MIIQWKWQTQEIRSDRQSAWTAMDRGLQHCSGGGDPHHPPEKEIKKEKVSVHPNPKGKQCQRTLKLLHNRPHLTHYHAAATAELLRSCPTLWDPTDHNPPGSPVPGILQARTLEWAAISFSSAWKWKGKVKSLSHVRLLATPWTAAYQAPLLVGFSMQE